MPPENQSAGATPVVEGATPSQTPPATPAAAPQPEPQLQPATGSDDGLGEAGKKALSDERAAKKAAERERDALKQRVEELENATKSDADKAVAAARKEGETAATDKWSGFIRAARVESALSGAGAIDAAVAAQAREFAALKVNGDTGDVEGLSEAVEAFKQAHPTLFGAATSKTPTGDFGGGNRSTNTQNRPASLEEAVNAHYGG
ncbi:MAG TPA: hypothetical protein VFM74_04585 [Candidatus Limnocylindria bacterium]|nr:hypothetical protein [Candidatus Limnocylindria bacterium]